MEISDEVGGWRRREETGREASEIRSRMEILEWGSSIRRGRPKLPRRIVVGSRSQLTSERGSGPFHCTSRRTHTRSTTEDRIPDVDAERKRFLHSLDT